MNIRILLSLVVICFITNIPVLATESSITVTSHVADQKKKKIIKYVLVGIGTVAGIAAASIGLRYTWQMRSLNRIIQEDIERFAKEILIRHKDISDSKNLKLNEIKSNIQSKKIKNQGCWHVILTYNESGEDAEGLMQGSKCFKSYRKYCEVDWKLPKKYLEQ